MECILLLRVATRCTVDRNVHTGTTSIPFSNGCFKLTLFDWHFVYIRHGMPPTPKEISQCPKIGGEALDECGNTAFIILVKNPYSWFLSMFKHPYEIHGGHTEQGRLDTFLKNPIEAPIRERAGNITVHENLIHLWNLKYVFCRCISIREHWSTVSA